MMHRFRDRTQAGQALARALRHHRPTADLPVIVAALPRGGVAVGAEVARELGAPLDVCVVRKLGVPGHEELAMGAIASGGGAVVNRDVVRHLAIPRHVIDQVAAAERRELERREQLYREGLPRPIFRDACVILVDDGLATGATMRAAVATMRQEGAAAVVVAVPVAPDDACHRLANEADDLVCLLRPDAFEAIGMWYDEFPQLTDDEVRRLLAEQHKPAASAP
jgi:predicted phosphoribosyltransferase